MKSSALRVATFAACTWIASCFQDHVPAGYDYHAGAIRDDGDDASADGAWNPSGENPGDGAVATGDAGSLEPNGACDLTGRWLATLHEVVSALGASQTIHTWSYYEITKDGDAFSISRGLYCGDDVTSSPALNVKNDTRGYWHTARQKINVANRAVASAQAGSGCAIHFSKWYMVLGLSDDYAADPSLPLPTADQQASAGQPGWEDWEPDGHPGITAIATSNIISGQLYTATRTWNEYDGTVENVNATFTLPVTWDQEQVVYDATSALLKTRPDVSHNPADNFVQFARLSAVQATGDDKTICDALVALAPKLTPSAAGFAP